MNLLSDIWSANIFPILCAVFSLSFETQKCLIFTMTNWFIFSFIACDIISKKSLPNARSRRFMPMFASKNISVISFTFGSLIHFELIFYMVGVRGPISFFCWCISSCSNIIFWKRLSFPLSTSLGTFGENQLTRDVAIWYFISVCPSFLILKNLKIISYFKKFKLQTLTLPSCFS